ncbi:DUF4130 domain-containing protein [Promethearchaeum syntrophicum]|uniref:DUF4130 domain-containing protein n=1 Tax=Promethearchaeum syntrophicum TaxID=2594042 RepID=A0A5B9DDB8_9ARCH|nr:DUF4130 domain-containing protein [Candidatus Prometheoarchaeum syntrophicum]QEE17309.1 hypothetical protein DSAG12_03142 [Candidatus Prometheoarchaeum syntrophicum]
MNELSKKKKNARLFGFSKEEMLENLIRHSNCNRNLLKKVQNTSESLLRNKGSPFARKIYRMLHEIFRELERNRQFTRTTLNNHGVLYGKISLSHQSEEDLLKYFHNRFPNCVICLYNIVKNETITMNEQGRFQKFQENLDECVQKISMNRKNTPYFEDITMNNEEFFQEFYSSQFIESRENRKYFKKMIPKYAMEMPGMKGGVENRFRNHQLDKYIKKNK